MSRIGVAHLKRYNPHNTLLLCARAELKMKTLSLRNRAIIFLMFIANSLVGLAPSDVRAAIADDLKVSQLEQDVRELQRIVQQQARRIEALESAMRQARVGRMPLPDPSVPAAVASAVSDVPVAWLQSANWDKLRPGMSEVEVIRVLGSPSTARKSATGNTQTLFYAREFEAGGFLSGQVILTDQRVVEIQRPTLK
jgi:hypothetical protein